MRIWPFTAAPPPVVEQKSLGDPTADELACFTGATDIRISTTEALTVPAVQCAVRVISEAAATLERCVVVRGADGTETKDEAHPVAALLRGDANGWTSSFELIRDLVGQALTSNSGGMAWVNRVNGQIAEIIQPTPGGITVNFDSLTNEPSFRLQGKPLDSADVVFVRGPFSRCPLALAADAIGTAKAMERFAGQLFKNGARPGGVIEFPKSLGDEGLKKMRTAWQSAFGGSDNSGKTAILWDGAKFVPMTLNSVDAQFQQLRVFQNIEIARAFRIPPSMLFEMDRATWSNTEQAGKEFLNYTLEPWLQALEGALTRVLFTDEERKTHRVRLDRDDLTRADLTARATAINSLVASKVLNANEARGWLDLAPRAGGEVYENPNITTEAPAV